MILEETWFQATIEVHDAEHSAWDGGGFSTHLERLFKTWTRFAGFYGRRWLCERHGREIVIYEVMIRVFGTEKIREAKTETRVRLQSIGGILVGMCRRIQKQKLVREIEAEWTLEEDGEDDLSKEMVGSKPPQWMIADKDGVDRPNVEPDCSNE
ncbi:hypothetical protein ETB97_005217 [Aspergillus alliaceus]|uniref:Uncharacterized protein n=1 Tax=Petromyces alliaceus TaxID=209559 RepID=A0A8H5ZVW2_PETAA|nr:hypothetical protein ETB97_005217 [Aspergillus burnettii]